MILDQRELVFLLEEPSARELLRGLLPRIVSNSIRTHFLVFQGKRDLENNITNKLRGWRNPQASFVILRDQDSGNCTAIKDNIRKLCAAADRHGVIIRIACHELESWYLGDLAAVEKAFPGCRVARHQNNAKFRRPDRLSNAAEELSRLVPEYQKVSGSRGIGPCLSIEGNCSHSFGVFISAIKKHFPADDSTACADC